jgi:hypothetical protein
VYTGKGKWLYEEVLYIAECQELKKTKQKTYSISGSESGVNTKPAIIR